MSVISINFGGVPRVQSAADVSFVSESAKYRINKNMIVLPESKQTDTAMKRLANMYAIYAKYLKEFNKYKVPSSHLSPSQKARKKVAREKATQARSEMRKCLGQLGLTGFTYMGGTKLTRKKSSKTVPAGNYRFKVGAVGKQNTMAAIVKVATQHRIHTTSSKSSVRMHIGKSAVTVRLAKAGGVTINIKRGESNKQYHYPSVEKAASVLNTKFMKARNK